jgi:nanoRNase/pAp phosphatase (c-di-AMP/oligoRNAs hydrolase)
VFEEIKVLFDEIIKFFDELNAKNIIILCHQNADPDAIYSAYAFSTLLKQSRKRLEVEIGIPKGINRLSKQLLKYIPVKIKLDPDIGQADAIVLIDTNTVQQLNTLANKVKNTKTPIIIIDHHAPHPETERLAKISITNENISSTCEIIYNFYEQTKKNLNENVAKGLFLGIASDTRHFALAKSSTLKIIAKLIDYGINAQEVLPKLIAPMTFSERIARLKACRRVKIFKINKWIVAISKVKSYQASAARAIITLGAHLAVVGGQKNEKLNFSLRSTFEFYDKTQVHLGRDIAQPLGTYLNGMGGGHSTAAGINGTGELEVAIKHCLNLLREKIILNP